MNLASAAYHEKRKIFSMNPLSSHFTAFDLLLLAVLSFSMIIGLARGFIREFFGLTAWGSALLLSAKDYPFLIRILQTWIQEPILLKMISHLCVFIVMLVLLLFIAQWLSSYVQNSMAQSIDRSLGIVFGFIRGLCIICACYIGSLFFVLPDKQPFIVKISKSRVFLDKSTVLAYPFLPSPLQKNNFFQNSMKELTPQDISSQQLTNELSSPPLLPK